MRLNPVRTVLVGGGWRTLLPRYSASHCYRFLGIASMATCRKSASYKFSRQKPEIISITQCAIREMVVGTMVAGSSKSSQSNTECSLKRSIGTPIKTWTDFYRLQHEFFVYAERPSKRTESVVVYIDTPRTDIIIGKLHQFHQQVLVAFVR